VARPYNSSQLLRQDNLYNSPTKNSQQTPLGDLLSLHVKQKSPVHRWKLRKKRETGHACLHICIVCFSSGDHPNMNKCMTSCSNEDVENVTCPSYN